MLAVLSYEVGLDYARKFAKMLTNKYGLDEPTEELGNHNPVSNDSTSATFGSAH